MKTKKLTFNVKDESLEAFFLKNSTQQLDKKDFSNCLGTSGYYLLKDEVFIKIGGDIEVGTMVHFELKDYSIKSNKPLINNYYYETIQHDSVSICLKLINFKITL